MDLHLLHEGICSLLTQNKRVPLAFACSNPLGFQSTLYLCIDSANTSLTFSFDECASEVIGSRGTYATCMG